uniref:NADH dehydrogenase subunit 3 n=1 Tax=Monacha cartusiana TaxID=225461 RepID=UPI0023D886FF|nr:NADH dehydrogenase subunit 3 [Monacha cartusiana]URP31103.1 NADH dehydrogenase subunit 3 [Monacha cartusiana]
MVWFFVASASICMLLYYVYILVNFTNTVYLAKLTPFECGFEPLGAMRRPFSVRFFCLVVLFLIFDVETVLLFPVVANMFMGGSVKLFTSLTIFLVTLLVGLLYEWMNGMLDWVT